MFSIIGLAIAAAAGVVMPEPVDVTIQHYDTDAAFSTAYGGDVFLALESRWGDNGGSGEWETGIWDASHQVVDSDQNTYPNGDVVYWYVTYDPSVGTVTFEVGDSVVSYEVGEWSGEDIIIRTRAAKENTSISVDDLWFFGAAPDYTWGTISGSSYTSYSEGGVDILWLSGLSLGNGFTLTGTTTMTWDGTPSQPYRSALAMQIKFGESVVPEPATMTLFGIGLAGYTLVRIKRRHGQNRG